MNAKQKIVQGRGPSNINLDILMFAPLMFAGLHNQSPPLTMDEIWMRALFLISTWGFLD